MGTLLANGGHLLQASRTATARNPPRLLQATPFQGKISNWIPAATISGTVFENDGSTPVTGGGYVQAYTGDPCGAYYSAGSASINSADGTYTINWLTTGSYFLKAYPSGNYLDEWWASPDSVLDCNSAQSVSATEGTTVSGKNFQLNPGAAISGTVFQHDGSTPVTGGGSVQAYIGDPCGSHSWAGSASINSTDGTYTINQLPTGSYFLEVYPYGNYFDEWWASPVSVLDCNGAQSVSATEGTTVSGKDFQLNPGRGYLRYRFPGTMAQLPFREAGMFTPIPETRAEHIPGQAMLPSTARMGLIPSTG